MNEYVDALGMFYDVIPKEIFASLAFSLMAELSGEGATTGDIVKHLMARWEVLHAEGIVTLSLEEGMKGLAKNLGMGVMKEVYLNLTTKEFSLDYDPVVSICVGETDGTLEEQIS